MLLKEIKHLLTNIFFAIMGQISPSLDNKASILMYHSVGEGVVFSTVPTKMFEKQIIYLKKNNYKIISLSDLEQKIKARENITKHVVLSFDDGYLNNYENVFPLLKKYNVPASIFVITNLIGKTITSTNKVTQNIMNAAQMREMHSSGLVEFLPHTRNHKELTALSEHEYTEEIEGSLRDLQNMFGNTPKIFAYPRGKNSSQIIKYLEKNNWRLAVGVNPGLVTHASSMLLLPRNPVNSNTSFVHFKGFVSQAIEWYLFILKK